MQSLSARLLSLLSVLLAVVAIALRFASLLLASSTGAVIAFYILMIISVLLTSASALRENNCSQAFQPDNGLHLDLASYASALGFFIEFVHKCIRIFAYFQGEDYKSLPVIVAMLCSCVLALFSSFYFFAIGLSYGDFGYDFRKLRLLHIAPLIWAVSNVFCVMTLAISPLKEVDSVIEYAMLVSAVIYFFFFAREVESNSPAMKATILFSRVFSCLCLVFFADRIMLLVTGGAELTDRSGILGVSVLLISLFSLLHQKSITKSIKGA